MKLQGWQIDLGMKLSDSLNFLAHDQLHGVKKDIMKQ